MVVASFHKTSDVSTFKIFQFVAGRSLTADSSLLQPTGGVQTSVTELTCSDLWTSSTANCTTHEKTQDKTLNTTHTMQCTNNKAQDRTPDTTKTQHTTQDKTMHTMHTMHTTHTIQCNAAQQNAIQQNTHTTNTTIHRIHHNVHNTHNTQWRGNLCE